MKRLLGYGSYLVGGTLLALTAQPVYAAATVITGVRVVPTDTGAQIILQTEAGDTPQVFAINQGNSLRADIVRTELRLANGEPFVRQDPAPGLASISLEPLDANSVRLTVNGSNRAPVGTISDSSSGGIVIDVETQVGSAPRASTPVPDELTTVPGAESIAQAEDAAEEPEAQEAPDTPAQNGEQPDVLVPNPQVIIDGVPVPEPQEQQPPPFLPGAVPPPVGDIAISDMRPNFGEIDLGTAERVPRLVLREAPSREVLTLLARAAGLNLVFIGTTPDGETDNDGPAVSVDIQDESVQDAFNSILQITGLQANRIGRLIYVAPRLPLAAQDIIVRSLRMNQVDAAQASNFLVGLGAERAVSRERERETLELGEVEEDTLETEQPEVEEEEALDPQAERVEFEDSVPIFRGLQVIAEERTNSVTLIGTPELVELATAQLVRIDLRKRQVAINVKVIDIDLDALDAFGTSFSFSNDDFNAASDGGVGIINFGDTVPGGTPGGFLIPGGPPIGAFPLVTGAPNALAEQFLASIFGTISEGNGKILTDPTLVIQEGQTASVALTEEVVTDVDVDVEVLDTGGTLTTVNVETEPAGLVLRINVTRIDDNGFVTLDVAPTITSPTGSFVVPGSGGATIALLSERQLSSGLVRIRDGQTFLVTGIIQETDRTEVTKVPILGDLPLIGALFRSTVRDNERLELIIVLTPEIIDDSDQAVFGYSYTPSEEVQELLERRGNP